MTKDLLRCQIAARNIALLYNWWSLFVRLADPSKRREAITGRCCWGSGAQNHPCRTGFADHHPRGWRSRENPGNAQPGDLLPQRVDGHCGAVDFRGTLASDLEQNI